MWCCTNGSAWESLPTTTASETLNGTDATKWAIHASNTSSTGRTAVGMVRIFSPTSQRTLRILAWVPTSPPAFGKQAVEYHAPRSDHDIGPGRRTASIVRGRPQVLRLLERPPSRTTGRRLTPRLGRQITYASSPIGLFRCGTSTFRQGKDFHVPQNTFPSEIGRHRPLSIFKLKALVDDVSAGSLQSDYTISAALPLFRPREFQSFPRSAIISAVRNPIALRTQLRRAVL